MCRWGKGGGGHKNVSVTGFEHIEAYSECTWGLECTLNPSLCSPPPTALMETSFVVFVHSLSLFTNVYGGPIKCRGEYDGE